MTSQGHPNMRQLTDYALGHLNETELDAVATHVETCTDCQETLENLAQPDDTLVHGLRQPAPEPQESFAGERECEDALAAVRSFGHAVEFTDDGAGHRTQIVPGDRPLGALRDYQLLAKLGQGGMGTVYKARHTKLDRLVAVKVLPAERMKDQQSVARFTREMRAVGNLDHPNIVRAHDAGEVDGKHFLVMELVDGIDLSTLVQQEGWLGVEDACELIRQAAVGLHHAHQHGLVHRDVKPSNLMLTADGTVKVLDLGLARLLGETLPEGDAEQPREAPADSKQFQVIGDELTGTDQVMGTPDYMAPEQCTDSRHVDIRSDVYSLGATLYKLLSGHAPFSGKAFNTVAKKVAGLTTKSVPPITAHRDDLPEQLVAVLQRMLAKQPADRYATPAAVAEALAPFAAGQNVSRFVGGIASEPSTATDPSTETPSTSAWPSAPRPRDAARASGLWRPLAGVAAALLVIVGGILLYQTVIRVDTAVGQVVVTATHPGVKIAIKQDDRIVRRLELTPKGQQVQLNAGGYLVEITDLPENTVVLGGDGSFELASGGTELVQIRLETQADAAVAGGGDATASPVAPVPAVPEDPSPVVAQGEAHAADAGTTGQDAAKPTQMSYHVSTLSKLLLVKAPDVPKDFTVTSSTFRRRRLMRPYAVLDGEGEVYLRDSLTNWRISGSDYEQLQLAVRAPVSNEVSGTVYLPWPDGSRMVALPFRIAPSQLVPEDRIVFLEMKRDHYDQLLGRNIPGGAWFRHQRDAAQRELNGGEEVAAERERRQPPRRRRGGRMEQTYGLLSGGQALSENLQLDRLLPNTAPDSETIDIDSLPGITVREFDFAPLIAGQSPELDPLAHYVPADQHALFFSSFGDLVDMIDHAKTGGTPLLRLWEPRGEDAQAQQRYERQLGLGLNALARKIGPQLVTSVAVTGGDPYLRMGSDVAVLFEAKEIATLTTLLDAQIALSTSRELEGGRRAAPFRRDDLQVSGFSVRSFVSEKDRSVCSYRAVLGDAVVVTNSRAQLERLIATHRGEQVALAALPEYKFFRLRYPRADESETGLLMISDATIRRWCSPHWRIGASRRIRAAAAMADVQATHLRQLVTWGTSSAETPIERHQDVAGALALTATGVHSSPYGSLNFLTPISELEIEKVTKEEADLYRRWRDGYQGNWSRFFDPIAVRLTARADKLAADVSVIPLIDNSQYRMLRQLSAGAQIDPQESDRHQESLLHLAWAFNKDAPAVGQFRNLAQAFAPQIRVDPFAWVGQTVSVYIDRDPFWARLATADNPEDVLRDHQVPVALHVDVVDGLKLTAFLAGLRAFIEQAAPGMTVWETAEHAGEPYVRVFPSARARTNQSWTENFVVCYSASGDSLTLTLNEKLLHRALDRQIARREAQQAGKTLPPAKPWIGDHLAATVQGESWHVLQELLATPYREEMQRICFGNLPILNEWQRRFPDRDPVELHETYWQRRLICPGGGKYRWNETWQTMESTAYGLPGEPKLGPALPPVLTGITLGDLGVTFEENGLRAKVVLERKSE